MRRLAHDRRGVAVVEFAYALPFLMLLLVGFSDIVHIGRGHLRAQSVATQLGQIVSQCKRVSAEDERVLERVARGIFGHFAKDGQWAVQITVMGRDADDKPFDWRMVMPDSMPADLETLVARKALGSTPPSDLALRPNQAVFRTEVFASVETMFFSLDNTLLRGRVDSRDGGDAYGSALHMTRAATTSGLKSQNAGDGSEHCLKEAS